jgi:hypothetical protein
MKSFLYIFLVSFFYFLNSVLIAQAPDTMWTKTFGGDSSDAGLFVTQTNDGGYIITGYTKSFGAGEEDVWLVKTNTDGDTLWTKTFGGIGIDKGVSVRQTTDGGYIIIGSTDSFGSGQFDIWVVKTNANGDLQWNKTFGGISSDYGHYVEEISNGGYIISGTTSSFGASDVDVWLIRSDADGDTLWTRTFGDSTNNSNYSVQLTTGEGYIIVWQGSERVWLTKTDMDGDTLWTKTFRDSAFGYYTVSEVHQTSDGGYIIVGTDGTHFKVTNGPFVIKTDANGEILWTKTLPVTPMTYGKLIRQTSDGGYIILGPRYCMLPTCGHIQDLLIKTDSNGDTLWIKVTSNVGWKNVQQTSDGGYIVTGSRDGDVLLIKVAPDVTEIDENPHISVTKYQLLQNYPNPFNPSTTIEFSLPQSGFVTLKIYNILGEVVATLVSQELKAGKYEYSWNAGSIASGVYIYELKAGDFNENRKMILLR